jgi:hypothetical protein
MALSDKIDIGGALYKGATGKSISDGVDKLTDQMKAQFSFTSD